MRKISTKMRRVTPACGAHSPPPKESAIASVEGEEVGHFQDKMKNR